MVVGTVIFHENEKTADFLPAITVRLNDIIRVVLIIIVYIVSVIIRENGHK